MSGTRHEVLHGKVQVYRRPGSEYWQCSATIDGHQHRISSKKESLSQAKDFAEDWYLTLRGQERFGGGVPKGKSKTFRKAAEVFLEQYPALTGHERNPTYMSNMAGQIANHLNPYFGNKPVASITEQDGIDYRVHRMSKPPGSSPPAQPYEPPRRNNAKFVGPLKPGNRLTSHPARSTLHSEMITLNHVMKTAKRLGWIAIVPSFRAPYQTSKKISHRAWFSRDEYEKLWKATQKRAAHPPNPKWKWECEQLHDYVLFLANTGLRPDEAARLEIRDVEITQDGQRINVDSLEELRELLDHCKAQEVPEPILEIDVRGKRGTGFCKSMPGAVRPFIRLRDRLRAVPEERLEVTRDRRKKSSDRRPWGTEPRRERGSSAGISRGYGTQMARPEPKELLFPVPQSALLNTILQEIDLKKDRDGQSRTAYSLRHTYICFRLIEGADIYNIAKNCRTSVEMIEKYYASHIKHLIDVEAVNSRNGRLAKEKVSARLNSEEY